MRSRPASKSSRPSSPMMVVLILLAALLAACGGDDADAARLVVDEPVADFGALFADEMRRHVFVLRNAGRRPLKIHRVKKDCGCLQPLLSRAEIPPGETAELTVDFRPPVLGKIGKRIWVYSDGPAGETVLRLRAEGQGIARISPRVLRLPEARADYPEGVVPLVVETSTERRLESVRFAISGPGLRIEPLPREAPHRLRFRLHLARYREPRSLRETVPVFVTTDDNPNPARLALPLQILGRSAPELWCRPCALHLGAGAPGAELVSTFDLRGDDARRGAWRPRWEGVTAAVIEGGTGGTYRIRATLPAASGRVLGRVVWEPREGAAATPAPPAIPVHAWTRRP